MSFPLGIAPASICGTVSTLEILTLCLLEYVLNGISSYREEVQGKHMYTQVSHT